MKIVKTANGKQELRISKVAWKAMGMKAGWIPTVLAKSKQNIVKTAQNVEISDEDIKTAMKSAILNWNYQQDFTLRDPNGALVDDLTAERLIREAFAYIATKYPNSSFGMQIRGAMAKDVPLKALGVSFDKQNNKAYLIPSYDGYGLTDLYREFTGFINGNGATIKQAAPQRKPQSIQSAIQGVSNLKELIEMINAAGYVAQNATVIVGSIGARSTNWSTSYDATISGLPAPQLLNNLNWFTSINNNTVKNQLRTQNSQSFDLSQFSEVSELMGNLGLGKEFLAAVDQVKNFEDVKGLKTIHDKHGKVPEYNKRDSDGNLVNTKVVEIKLQNHLDEILDSLIQRIANHPSYKDMMEANGLRDLSNTIDIVFSMGVEGDIIDANNADTVINLLSEAQEAA